MNIKLSPVFSDRMVLQRDKEVMICGQAEPNATVTVAFMGGEYICRADKAGSFECSAGTHGAGGPYQMTISAANERIVINDILIGDVWLCGGQSNMEMLLNRAKHFFPDELAEDNNPFIRQFEAPKEFFFDAPKDGVSGGCWKAAVNENLPDFTAVGYFFAKRLYKQYQIPIGLYAAAVGGTPVSAWMSEEMLADFPNELAVLQKHKDPAYIAAVEQSEKEYFDSYYAELEAADTGLIEGWREADYDDGDWDERELTEPFCEELQKTGSVWFRNTVEIPKSLWGKPATVFMGTITDADQIFLNGEYIGETTYRYPPRENFIEALPEGECVIAVRLLNYSGDGGFTKNKPRFIVSGNYSVDLDGVWKYKRAAYAPKQKDMIFFNRVPSGLYNGMIHPLRKQKIKGVIWYQGESDADNPEGYFEKCKALVSGWRAAWGDEFPFLFTELSYWENTDWDSLRKQQRKTLTVANTGMAHSADVGEYNDIHPLNKQTVGNRLARVALRVAYGETLPPSPFETVISMADG